MNDSIQGIDRYLSVGVRRNDIYCYLFDGVEPGNRKTDVMFLFMRDAGLGNRMVPSPLCKKLKVALENHDSDAETTIWAIALVNLCHRNPLRYYIEHVPLFEEITLKDIFPPEEEMRFNEAELKTRTRMQRYFWNGLKIILCSNETLRQIGLGEPSIVSRSIGKTTMNSIKRSPWFSPVPEVILYALYKFSEACNCFRFSLDYLMDETIERDGVSPATIFGLDRDTMLRILNGLSINYPSRIGTAFNATPGMITLYRHITTDDIIRTL